MDRIVEMLLNTDRKARRANKRFHNAVALRRKKIMEICGQSVAVTEGMKPSEVAKLTDRYHHKINPEHIKLIEEVEADYKRRQGNMVLNLARFIKPEYYERKKNRKYKTNDNFLKRRLNISRRSVDRACKKFINSFGIDSELLERDFTRRLQEIEEEIERKRKEGNAEGNGSGNGETK